MTCRSTSSTTTCAGTQTAPQLSYDNEGRLSHWQNLPSSPYETDDFLYDGEGNRVEQKTTNGSTVTTTTYIGNLEEVATSGTTTTVTTYYYVGGQRVALAVNGTVSYLATDAISSVSVALDTSGDVQASQLFYPHGGVRFSSGTMPGTYGFTGQRKDGMTGLDYYNARYYDPVPGQFTSADSMLPGKGYDPWGLSRYAYVEGNPIARTDPSGHCFLCSVFSAVTNVVKTVAPVVTTVLDATTGIPSMINDVQTIFSGNTSTMQKLFAIGDIALNVAMDAQMVVGSGEGERAAYMGVKAAEEVTTHALEDGGEHALEHVAEDDAEHAVEDGAEEGATCGLSFSAATLVATPGGERAISTLHVGDQVLAYDPATHQVSAQVVLHVWINHDTDLVDVTIQTQAGSSGQANTKTAGPGQPQQETIHTTARHPWLTSDQGWVIAGKLKIGEPVMRADGQRAMVVAIRVLPGASAMYDLEVSQVHTFAVGSEQVVVHNCAATSSDALGNARRDYVKQHLKELIGDDAEGTLLEEQKKIIPNVGSFVADFETDKALIEVGGVGKAGGIGQIIKYGQYTRDVDTSKQAYLLYDLGSGDIPARLQGLADKWGVKIVGFGM